jgi:ribosome-associated translation inhibitor RaiA
MVVETRFIGFPRTDAILRHVEGRVEAAVGFATPRVLRLTVRLDDVNGDHGGPDKRCRVVAALRHHRTLAAEAVDVDLYAAIDAACQKLRASVLRELKRDVARARRDPQRPGTLVPA